MKLKGKLKFLLFITLFALSSAFIYGCKKDTPKPEPMATSEAVLAEKAAEDAKMAEEARKAEEARRAAAEEAQRREEARRAEEMRKAAEEARRVEEAETAKKDAALKNSHRVKKGECLWVIAEDKKVYNNPFKWPLIYKTNRDQIKDPDLIYPDQVFEIPRNSSNREVKEAIHEAKTRGPWSLWDRK